MIVRLLTGSDCSDVLECISMNAEEVAQYFREEDDQDFRRQVAALLEENAHYLHGRTVYQSM
jgi:hypothetical protein